MKNANPSVAVLLLVIIVITTFLPINSNYAQNTRYSSLATEFAASHPYTSFDVYTEIKKDNSVLEIRHERVILKYDDKSPIIFSEIIDEETGRAFQSWLLDKGKYIHIDHNAQEITRYENKKVFWDDYHGYGLMEFVPNTFYYLSYYIYSMKNKIRGGLLTYTISDVSNPASIKINDELYTSFRGISSGITRSYDSKSKKWVIVHNEADFFVNQHTRVMDSVYAVRYPQKHETLETFVKVKNVDFSDKQRYIDSVMDIGNPMYRNYSRHDSKNPPLSRSYSDNKNATDNLLDYPIEKISGGRTTLAENDGWILLNFWSVNCTPCVAHLKEMGQEKESTGNYFLESQGVKILAINHRSDNAELIRSIAEKTNTRDIIYYAKGMGGVINIPSLGYYYLISPDRQIVYETGDLGDYSELLEAKANYKKIHQIK